MNDNESNGNNSSGRVKGSIKDRLKSFLYRKRFRIKLMKNSLIKKEVKVSINVFHQMKIASVRDLKKLGDKVIPVDLKTEKFDFEKYDYYIIEPVKKKGIDDVDSIWMDYKKRNLKNGIHALDKIKSETKSIEINLKYPEPHKEDIKEKQVVILSNKDILKEEIINADVNIDLSKLDILTEYVNNNDIKNINEIIDYYDKIIKKNIEDIEIKQEINNIQFKKNVGIAEDYVDNKILDEEKKDIDNNVEILTKNNQEDSYKEIKINNNQENNIVVIKNLNVYKNDKKQINNKINEKKVESNKKIHVLNKFDGYKIRQLKNNQLKAEKEIKITSEIVEKMNKEVDKVTKEISEVTKITGYGRMIKSCASIATGVLTLPFSGLSNIFNIALGTSLINRGLRGVRKGLDTKSEIKVDYKYEDLSKKIHETKDKVDLTSTLIKDSLYQISEIKKSTYLGVDNLKILENLEKDLNDKLKEIDAINNTLNKQEERNKIKIRKVERREY